MSETQDRKDRIAKELDAILKDAKDFVWEHLEEEDLEEEALRALRQAAHRLAYTHKYYNVLQDKFVYFPSVARLILKADLTQEAEQHYYEEEDEWPLEYTKALKSVVRARAAAKSQSQGHADQDEDEDDEDEEYMEKLATPVDFDVDA